MQALQSFTGSLSGAIPTVFGNGIVGSLMTATLRIPTFMANITAIAIIAELSLRGVTNTLGAIGFSPSSDSWIVKIGNQIDKIRPYKDVSEFPVKDLAVRALGCAVLSVIGTEFVRLVGGTAPGIYNHVLKYVGSIQVNPTWSIFNVLANPLRP